MISGKSPRTNLTEADAERIRDEQLRAARSMATRRGWQTRREQDAARERNRPLGGPNTPVETGSVCDESLLRSDPVCPARILDLCGGCSDGPTSEQVDAALAAGPSPREWVEAAFAHATQRMVDAAERAEERYDAALEQFHGRHGVADADTPSRRVNAVLNAAQQVAHLPELPDLGQGPRVHAYTPATPGLSRHLLGNTTPTRYELLTGKGGTLTEQDPAAPTAEVPASARRLLAAAHESGLCWDLTVSEKGVRLIVRGLGRPSASDTWVWKEGRLDRLHTTGRPLREALAALTTDRRESPY